VSATDPEIGEVWQDFYGTCLAYVRGLWFAFGVADPLPLSVLVGRDRPVRRLLTVGGHIAPERLVPETRAGGRVSHSRRPSP
jgi:hypothetical protein